MLSEEEIKKIEKLSRYCALKNIDREDDIFAEFVVIIQKARNYIKQLETNNKKVIEYIEKKMCEYDETIIELVLQNILAVAKGEKKC